MTIAIPSCGHHGAVTAQANGVIISRGHRHDVPPGAYVAFTIAIPSCGHHGAVAAQAYGVRISRSHRHDVPPAADIALTITIPSCGHHGAVTAQAHGVIPSRSHRHDVLPEAYIASTITIPSCGHHCAVAAQAHGVTISRSQWKLLGSPIALYRFLGKLRAVLEVQSREYPERLQILSGIQQSLGFLIGFLIGIHLSGILCFLGAVLVISQGFKGFCRLDIFPGIQQSLGFLIGIQLSGVLRFLGAVFVIFQGFKGFRRLDIFPGIQQSLCGLVVIGGLYHPSPDSNPRGKHHHCRHGGNQPFGQRLFGLWFGLRSRLWRLRLGLGVGLLDFREQALLQFRHGLCPLLCHNRHGLFQGFQGSGGEGCQARQIPANGVLLHSIHGHRGKHSGEGVVNGSRHGVYIRPGAGAAPLGVLLEGTKAAFRHLHGGGAGVDAQILGRPQIQNFHASIRGDHQIVRA